MGRKRITDSTELVRLNASGRYDYPMWDEKLGRNVWKSTGETDKTRAENFARHKIDGDKWKTASGGDLTFDDGHRLWFEAKKDDYIALDIPQERYNHIAHIVGPLRLADPDTATVVDDLMDDLLKGVPMRNGVPRRIFPESKFSKRNKKLVRAKLHPRTVANSYLAHLTAVVNFLCEEKRNGEPLLPRRLAPVFRKVDPDSKPSKVKAVELFLDDEQIAACFAYTEKVMREKKQTRLSVNYRLLLAFQFGGQRSSRVGRLPWRNFKGLNTESATVDFSDIPGLKATPIKKGKKDMPIPPEYLPVLRRCYTERTGEWFLDAPLVRTSIYSRLRIIYKRALGIDYGGGHVQRKTYVNRGVKSGQRDHLPDVVGVTAQTLNKFYIKNDPHRDRAAVNAVAKGGFVPRGDGPKLGQSASVVTLQRKGRKSA